MKTIKFLSVAVAASALIGFAPVSRADEALEKDAKDPNQWVLPLGSYSGIRHSTLGQITPLGVVTEFVIPTAGSFPAGITFAPDGSLWFADQGTTKAIGRAPVAGGTANNNFIPSAVPASNAVCGVAVNSQYVYWGNSGASDFIGRANLSGGLTFASQ